MCSDSMSLAAAACDDDAPMPMQVSTRAQAPGVLQKLGRVLKEKAGEDFQRVFQGTSKTREKLGVRSIVDSLPR